MQFISIIIPVLNESKSIEKTLLGLEFALRQGHELVIVDGGSTDDTLEKCKQHLINLPYTTTSFKIVSASKGRACQMNVGAVYASNDVLVFLHADTLVPDNFVYAIVHSLQHKPWGFFKVRLSAGGYIFKLVSFFINLRSCVSGIATGDQAIFVTKNLFKRINGYKELPLMEDIELSRSLKKHSRPCCVNSFVTTSSRKWETEGVFKTIFLMWKIRLLYFMGISSHKLVKLYYK